MGESLKHIQLVQRLYEATCIFIPATNKGLIIVDSPESNEKPSITAKGYRPDLYYCYDNILIIGEAKTSQDFDRRHSKEQYRAFLKTCEDFEGLSYLLLAVPWTEVVSARNLLKRIIRQNNYNIKVIVINDLGRLDEI